MVNSHDTALAGLGREVCKLREPSTLSLEADEAETQLACFINRWRANSHAETLFVSVTL